MQATQLAQFTLMPSFLLSGFMFPFRGMPGWAQDLGSILPLTHYLRVVRSVMLKGSGFSELSADTWPLALFALVAMGVAIKRFRQTLD